MFSQGVLVSVGVEAEVSRLSEAPAGPESRTPDLGISSSGGGGIGVCVQGARASYTSAGVW